MFIVVLKIQKLKRREGMSDLLSQPLENGRAGVFTHATWSPFVPSCPLVRTGF